MSDSRRCKVRLQEAGIDKAIQKIGGGRGFEIRKYSGFKDERVDASAFFEEVETRVLYQKPCHGYNPPLTFF